MTADVKATRRCVIFVNHLLKQKTESLTLTDGQTKQTDCCASGIEGRSFELLTNLDSRHEFGYADVVIVVFRQETFAGNFDFGRALGEVGQDSTFLLDQKALREQLDVSLENF